MTGSDRPRIDPVPIEDLDPEIAALVEAAGGLNVFTTLANHPGLFKRWMVFGAHVLVKTSLPARARELAILRTGWRCGSSYEFGQHTVIGQREGLGEDEIRRVATDGTEGWDPVDSTLLRAVDQLVVDREIDDATWDELAMSWSQQQMMDLVFTVGQYVLVSTALRTFGVQPEPGLPGFPG